MLFDNLTTLNFPVFAVFDDGNDHEALKGTVTKIPMRFMYIDDEDGMPEFLYLDANIELSNPRDDDSFLYFEYDIGTKVVEKKSKKVGA